MAEALRSELAQKLTTAQLDNFENVDLERLVHNRYKNMAALKAANEADLEKAGLPIALIRILEHSGVLGVAAGAGPGNAAAGEGAGAGGTGAGGAGAASGGAGGAGAGASGTAPAIVMSISKVSTIGWQRISHTMGMDPLVVVSQPPLRASPVPDTQPFAWTTNPESAPEHGTAAVGWVNKYISPPSQHEWVDCTRSKHFLDCFLPGTDMQLKGSTDLALCTSAAVNMMMASNGLRMVVELKKVVKQGQAHQLAAELLAANCLCPRFKPIAVLTDLADKWHLMWIDQRVVKAYACPDRAQAIGILRAFLEKERLTPDGAFIAQQPPVELATAEMEEEASGLLKRQRLQVGTGGPSDDVANLDDLLDFTDDLEEDDMHQITCRALLQQLLERHGQVAPPAPHRGDMEVAPPTMMYL